MPTGYTSNIGNDQTFEDFLLGCARAFGACLHQRDDASGEKPKLRTVDDHYNERILEAAAELGAFVTMNRQQRETTGQELKDEAIEHAQKRFNEKVLLKNKYDAMLQQVYQWNPPTQDHANLKQFMIDQINESVKFDCDMTYALKDLQDTQSKTPEHYHADRVKALEWDVKYYTEESEKEAKRVEEANRWISALYDSLGIEYEYVAD